MDDQIIIDLFWNRDERAIEETERKYGAYCRSIARNILWDRSEQEECLNDTWLKTWNSIPPQRPKILAVYLGTITRNLALNRLRHHGAQKRGSNQLNLAYEELQESVPAQDTVEELISAQELGKLLDRFLRTLPQKDACILTQYASY